MAETDSANAESVRALLVSPSHEELAIVVDQLFPHQESDEYQTARALYDYCADDFTSCLTLKLLTVYQCSSDDVLRFRSILLLSQTLTDLRNLGGFRFPLFALHDIKPLLISCLKMPKATNCDTKILRIIVSFVSSNVFMSDNGRWDELGDCIHSLALTDPLRAFSVFIDLPPVYKEFINRFLLKLVEEMRKSLLNPKRDRDEDWTLALETAIKLGIQLLGSDMRSELTMEILEVVEKCAETFVSMGIEDSLEQGLEHLVKVLTKDASLCKWSTNQCDFVAEFAFRVGRFGTQTKETAKKIYQMVTKLDKYVQNPAFRLSPPRVENQDLRLGDDLDFYYTLGDLSALDILTNFATIDLGYRSRETAIRRLHVVLCDHTIGKWELELSEIRRLQPWLIRCLNEKGMPENMFRILGQVVFHVAQETMAYETDPWFELWDYIAAGSKNEFNKAVYIFQCLTMRFDVEDFVLAALKNLLPEMYKRLNPPGMLLVDNCCWVLPFTGAFCAAIRLIDVATHALFVKEIASKMIDSVKDLVKRGMEVGLVRRAFRDVESIVEKQWEWYDALEYRFVKGLLWRLSSIEGMKMESKAVLWRINMFLERNVSEERKVLPKTELDWLNQPQS